MSGTSFQRQGKNTGRYFGERINIRAVLEDVHRLASETGWEAQTILESPELTILGYHRLPVRSGKRLYLSTGIHGDEPAGPLAVKQLLQDNQWPADVEIWLVPCLNPGGFELNTRENAFGIDLNRDYRHFATPEVQAHIAWLRSLPRFDLTVLLHEDWEATGFYLYELNPELRYSFAGDVIDAVRSICPIETRTQADNWDVSGGVISPKFNPEERPQWAEAVYLVTQKSPQTYTLEAPSDYDLPLRVSALVTAVKAVLRKLSEV